MDFEYSAKTKELQKKLLAFMDEHIYPNEPKYYAHIRSDKRWEPVPIIEELKPKAKAAGLWNLFLSKSPRAPGGGLSNLDYAPLCEIMGRRASSCRARGVVAGCSCRCGSAGRYGAGCAGSWGEAGFSTRHPCLGENSRASMRATLRAFPPHPSPLR